MAKRNVVTIGDDILRKKCRTVESFDKKLATLLDDMAQTMYAENGVGLAGPQVGMLKRVVVVDVDGILYELVNPVVVDSQGSQTGAEGCLSIPGEQGIVTRPMKVTVEAFDRNGKKFSLTGTELLARALCHEIDHLDGILYVDIAEEMLEE